MLRAKTFNVWIFFYKLLSKIGKSKLDNNTGRMKCFANSCFKFRVTAFFDHFLVDITGPVRYTIF